MSDLSKYQVTPDEIEAIKSVQYKMFAQSRDMGWHDKPREDGTMIALIHSEISEALESCRKNTNDDHLKDRFGAEVELADAVIRIFDFAQKKGWDIASAIAEKSAYNRTRADHQLANRQKEGGKSF